MAKRAHRVRIQAGALRGRWLRYPSERIMRPTMQRTKSSVFESIAGELPGAVFVDLYAGAGGVGIEALSRGARFAHFVERERVALRYLRDNLVACQIGDDRARVHAEDVVRFLEGGGLARIAPDIVYADPPYAQAQAGLLLEFLAKMDYSGLGLFVLEHDKNVTVNDATPLVLARQRVFGQSAVSFFRPQGEKA